jgi:hypothetical protein
MIRETIGIAFFSLVVIASTHYQSTRMSEVIGGKPDCNSRKVSEHTCYTHEQGNPEDPCRRLTGYNPSYGLYHAFLNWNLHADVKQKFDCYRVVYKSRFSGLTYRCAGDEIIPGTMSCNVDYFTFWIF